METEVAHKDATDQLLRPAGFKLDDWPAFNAAIVQAAELFGRMLGKLVTGELTVEVGEVVAGLAGDLIDQNQPYVTNVLHAPGWDAKLLVGTSRNSTLRVVEMFFGGSGPADGLAVDRDCTRIELAAAGLMFRYLAAVLQSSFAPVTDPEMEPGTCVDEVILDELGGPEEPIVLVRLACVLMEQNIEVFIAVAQRTLSAVGDPLRVVVEDQTETSDPKWSEHFDRQFRRADVDLTAIMDGGALTLDEVSRLRPGQVLELEATVDSLIKVDCNGHPMLWCRLGQADGSFVLRVEQFFDAEQDLMEELLTANAVRN
ncbi:MAG: FliM/FliN family flagellar motor switch protein [Hyphomicrobiales bacterium]|nr:FliM/FliN family flagellar motor switch protein [Hyphomicrobiales bacterium]